MDMTYKTIQKTFFFTGASELAGGSPPPPPKFSKAISMVKLTGIRPNQKVEY